MTLANLEKKQTKAGKTFYKLHIEGNQENIICWDTQIENYIGKELPADLKRTETTNDYGTTVTLQFPKSQGSGGGWKGGGGGQRTMAPEDRASIERQKSADLATRLIEAGINNAWYKKDEIVGVMAVWDSIYEKIHGVISKKEA